MLLSENKSKLCDSRHNIDRSHSNPYQFSSINTYGIRRHHIRTTQIYFWIWISIHIRTHTPADISSKLNRMICAQHIIKRSFMHWKKKKNCDSALLLHISAKNPKNKNRITHTTPAYATHKSFEHDIHHNTHTHIVHVASPHIYEKCIDICARSLFTCFSSPKANTLFYLHATLPHGRGRNQKKKIDKLHFGTMNAKNLTRNNECLIWTASDCKNWRKKKLISQISYQNFSITSFAAETKKKLYIFFFWIYAWW